MAGHPVLGSGANKALVSTAQDALNLDFRLNHVFAFSNCSERIREDKEYSISLFLSSNFNSKSS